MCSWAALYFVRLPCPHDFKATGVSKRSAILCFLIKTVGGGGSNLVYGSSSSSYMDYEVHCVSSVPIRLIGIRFTHCSYIVAFVDDLFIHGCSFYGSTTLRMSTRRLSVMIFVFLVLSDCYILLFVAWCACGGRGVFV